MTQEVRLRIRLELIAGEYKREAREAATATSKLADETDNVATKTGQLQDRFGGLATAAKVFLASSAVVAVKRFADESIQSFSELEQASGAVEAVFAESTRKIERWAESAAGAIGMSESGAKQAAATIGAFLKNYGFSIDEAADKSIELVNLGADLAAMFGGTVPEAVGAISSALRGEFNPIERYGVSLRVATIEAHALAMGLAATKSSLTQQDRMMATLDLLTRQTADAHGQFARELDTVAGKQAVYNAELENSKALLGEILAPMKQATTSLQIMGAVALSDTALEWMRLSGQISEAEGFFKGWRNAVAAGKDSNEIHAHSLRQLTDRYYILGAEQDRNITRQEKIREDVAEYVDMLRVEGATVEDLTRLRADMAVLLGEESLAYQVLTETIDEAIAQAGLAASSTNRHADRIRDRTRATEDDTDAQDDNAEATRNATSALQAQHDLLRGITDPIFALSEANRRAAEAQRAVNEAVEEHGAGSREHLEALERQALAYLDLRDKQIKVTDSGQQTREEFIRQRTALGLTHEEAELLADAFERLNAFKFDTKTIRITTQTPRSNDNWQIPTFDSGGVVPGPKGSPQLIMAHGGETILPTHRVPVGGVAQMVSNNSVTRGDVNINMQSVSPQTDAQRVGALMSVLGHMETI